MEIGAYGWSKNLNLFQSHLIYLNSPPEITANHGVLNLGNGPFDGSSTGKFSGDSTGTLLAMNPISGFTGKFVDLQVSGVSKFSVDYVGNTVVTTGSFSVRDAATPTKQYRFRTNGGSLDLEFGGNALYISGWTGADFTGTQRFFFQFDPNNALFNMKSGFFPDVNNAQDMGATGNYWANLFCTKVLLNSTATIDGNTAGIVNITGHVNLSAIPAAAIAAWREGD